MTPAVGAEVSVGFRDRLSSGVKESLMTEEELKDAVDRLHSVLTGHTLEWFLSQRPKVASELSVVAPSNARYGEYFDKDR